VAIRELRERAGLSQSDVAKLVGVQTATVSRWENRHDVPTKANQRRLAKLFKVTLGELGLWD
jgi:transcriptional regulator with XRE-family HTH domain